MMIPSYEPDDNWGNAPNAQEFLIEKPLYKKYNLDYIDSDLLGNYLFTIFGHGGQNRTLEAYCCECGEKRIFQSCTNRNFSFSAVNKPYRIANGVYIIKYVCAKCQYKLTFIVLYKDNFILKCGQYPTHADLIKPMIQKYRKVLTKLQLEYWQRAIGLSAHGVGIGSFVYLRRVIEELLEEAHGKAEALANWDDKRYKESHWDKKINLLSDYLPSFLVENNKVYNILSKGLHELKDQECLDYFEIINQSIMLICIDKRNKREYEENLKEVKKALSKTHKDLHD